ncbi:MAG TPA: hypothetical protein VKY57_17470 [Chitinispirillaceae bacterium]|nr:hypothetical protein [Chitinispirillaceae bacterium]
MDSVSAVSASIDAVNQVMQNMNKETLDMAKKLIQVNVNLAVGEETGKGQLIDMIA